MRRRYIPLLVISAAAAALILFPQISVSSVQKGLKSCAEGIIPSLFPFLILTNLWCSLGYSDKLSKKAETLMAKLFHLPGSASSALLIGSIGGFPAGAKTAAELYKSGNIQKKHAEQVLLFCSNAGPAFIFGIIGHGLFNSTAVGFFLWFIHFFGALILGVLFRPEPCTDQLPPRPSSQCNSDISSAIVSAIQNAGTDVLRICMFIVFFSIVTGFLQALIPANYKNTLLCSILLSALELSGASSLLKEAAPEIAFVAASALLAWNGLCVHCQVRSVVAESGLSLKKYYFGKLMHMIISLTLACLLAPIIPFHRTDGTTISFTALNGALVLLLFLFIFVTKTSYRKRERFRI